MEEKPSPRGARWGQDRRLEFIDFRLQWEGSFNRADLTEFFGISVPQASLDIARYLEAASANLEYDRSSRAYVALPGFTPIFASSSPERYCSELLAITEGIVKPDESYIGWHPTIDTVPTPGRSMHSSTLKELLSAIRNKQSLGVLYQSMTRSNPSHRILSPHAIAYDGFRWHVRAFCHARQEFRDFVIARILEIKERTSESVDATRDHEWLNILTLVLTPNPQLTDAHRRAVEMDYGMENGQVEFKCREALIFYTLKKLGFDKGSNQSPRIQHIVLKNEADLRPYLQLLQGQSNG